MFWGLLQVAATVCAFTLWDIPLVRSHHPCLRECHKHAVPMVCHYRFEIETYYTMSKACYDCPLNKTDCNRRECIPADGIKRPITVVNRQLPGPSIQVCSRDTIVVDVVNKLLQESTSIHWHGHHQRQTPYMDGVPYVTQCPIPPGNTFQYVFETEGMFGTHFWHSHTGCQRTDGAFGSLIIRRPKSQDPHYSAYDHDLPEHTIQITDWIHEPALTKMAAHLHSNGNNKPDSIIVNGKGRWWTFNGTGGLSPQHTPLETFTVQKGKRYRFRIVNAGFLNCPIQMSFDNHSMMVISGDGFDIQPASVQSLVTYAGERWDVIVEADQPVANYWVKFRGLLDCGHNSIFALAILHYEGAPDAEPDDNVTYATAHREGLQLNPVNIGSGELDFASAVEISHIEPEFTDKEDPALKLFPDVSLTLAFDFYPLDNPMLHKHNLYGFHQVKKSERVYTPQINHISLAMPSVPLLSQAEDIPAESFCRVDQTRIDDDTCSSEFCQCTYTIDIPLNATVEITLIDIGSVYDGANHPFHLHGHSFRVIALEKLGNSTSVEEVKSLDSAGDISRNLKTPPMKDTVTVPDGGFTILRFHASNPGYWLLHCHLDFHVEMGMAVIFKVGERKHMPPVPHGFPKCGNYYYNEHREDLQLNLVDSHKNDDKRSGGGGRYVYNADGDTDNSLFKLPFLNNNSQHSGLNISLIFLSILYFIAFAT